MPPAPVAASVTALLHCPANPVYRPGAGLFYNWSIFYEVNMARRGWNNDEDARLIERYPDSSISELQAIFPGRSGKAIIARSKRLKLRKSDRYMGAQKKRLNVNLINANNHPRKWSKADDHRLTELYPVSLNTDLVKIFKRSVPSIQSRARILGISKSDAQRSVSSSMRHTRVALPIADDTPIIHHQQWMVSELASFLSSKRGFNPRLLEQVSANLAALVSKPPSYWKIRATKPLIEWFREVGAA